MPNGKKDRLDRIEELLEKNAAQLAANAKAWSKTDTSLAHAKELLLMCAAQTAENKRELARFSKEFRADLAKSRKEHDREMKEIRVLFKQMIRRIAV